MRDREGLTVERGQTSRQTVITNSTEETGRAR